MRRTLLLLVSFVSAMNAASDGRDVYSKNCARCHELPPLSTRAQMVDMAPEFVLSVLNTGAMRRMGAALSGDERNAVAEFVTGKTLAAAKVIPTNACASKGEARAGGAEWNGWGVDLQNSRFQKDAGLTADQIPRLQLLWAFGFPDGYSTYSQPSVVGERIYVGSPSGLVYALDKKTGCTHWTFDAGAGVRSAIVVGPDHIAYFGDTRANVFAVNAETGRQVWKVAVEDHPSARVTGAPKLYKGRVYVGVASRDEWFAADPTFECCRFRGSVVALNAKTGKQIWKTYTIAEPAQKLAVKRGTQVWGPSGVSVWSSPTIDVAKNLLYVGTGDSYAEPPTPMSDSILAISLVSGKIVWKQQMTAGDMFTANCLQQKPTTCADKPGPDSDFGASPILHTLKDGRRILLAGQKSGTLYALDPDHEGKMLWQAKLSGGGILGGIQWGPAADEERVYAAISGLGLMPAAEGLIPNPKVGGGLHAIQIATGEKLWSATPAPCSTERHGCSPAQSAAISAIPGAVFSGSLDGHLRAFSSKDGAVIWDYDTAKDFETVNKVPARGGSLDGPGPVVVDGMVFVNSGYAFFNGMPGNVLLAFAIQPN